MHSSVKAVALVAAAGMVVALAGCTTDSGEGGGSSLADMEPIVLTSAEFGAEATAAGRGAHVFYDYIEEQTEGKVTFEVYWGSSLFGGSETIANVSAGVADLGQFSSSFNPDDIPVAQYILQAGVLADASYPIGYFESTAATHEMFTTNEDIIADFADNNLFVLSAYSTPRYGLLCQEPVTTPAEAAGMRTRVGGGAWVGEAEALGMATQFTPVPEIYEALQRGVLDCIVLPPASFKDLSYWEIAKHFVPTAFSNFPGGLRVVNLDTWNSLPDEVKQIFADAVAHEFEENLQANLEALRDFIQLGADEQGVQYYDPAALDEVITAQQEATLAALPDNMPEVADPQAFIDQYAGLIAKWHDIFLEAGFGSGPEETIVSNAVEAVDDGAWKEPFVSGLLEASSGRYAG